LTREQEEQAEETSQKVLNAFVVFHTFLFLWVILLGANVFDLGKKQVRAAYLRTYVRVQNKINVR
jgi:hypothetical protein